jgi:hypothetical protein
MRSAAERNAASFSAFLPCRENCFSEKGGWLRGFFPEENIDAIFGFQY